RPAQKLRWTGRGRRARKERSSSWHCAPCDLGFAGANLSASDGCSPAIRETDTDGAMWSSSAQRWASNDSCRGKVRARPTRRVSCLCKSNSVTETKIVLYNLLSTDHDCGALSTKQCQASGVTRKCPASK